MIRLKTIFFASALALVASHSAVAQRADDIRTLTKEIEGLKAGQAAILRELRELKGALQQEAPAPVPTVQVQPANRPAPQVPEVVDITLGIVGAPVKGDKNAKVTVVEFTDYQCPFCSRHFRQTWPQLEQDFVRTGKAKFVLRDLPIESIHPLAFKAAEAANCAGRQGKFWEMHDVMFANPSALDRKDLTAHAKALGLDVAGFDSCVDSGATAGKIRQDIADSHMAGARGTPIFFVGLTDSDNNQLKAVRIIRGAHSYATFKDTIEGLLSSAK